MSGEGAAETTSEGEAADGAEALGIGPVPAPSAEHAARAPKAKARVSPEAAPFRIHMAGCTHQPDAASRPLVLGRSRPGAQRGG